MQVCVCAFCYCLFHTACFVFPKQKKMEQTISMTKTKTSQSEILWLPSLERTGQGADEESRNQLWWVKNFVIMTNAEHRLDSIFRCTVTICTYTANLCEKISRAVLKCPRLCLGKHPVKPGNTEPQVVGDPPPTGAERKTFLEKMSEQGKERGWLQFQQLPYLWRPSWLWRIGLFPGIGGYL